MKNKTPQNGGYEWIPWQRYVLLLSIDGKQAINLGRFRRREAPSHIAERLNLYRGYKCGGPSSPCGLCRASAGPDRVYRLWGNNSGSEAKGCPRVYAMRSVPRDQRAVSGGEEAEAR